MKTYVVYPVPDDKKDARFGYSVSCLTLATMLQSVSEVAFWDMTLQEDPVAAEGLLFDSLKSESDKKTIVVFFDSVPLHRSSNVSSARTCCAKIKSLFPETQIIACGPYCMIRGAHEWVADVTIIDEPECSVVSVLEGRIDTGCLTVLNEKTKPIRLLESLGCLPIPDRSLLPTGSETPFSISDARRLAKSAVLSTSRGCLGACTFCPRGAWNQRRIRHRPIDAIVEEVHGLIYEGYRNIWVDDENMGVDIEWSIDLFKRIEAVNRERLCGFYISAWGCLPEVFFEYAFRAGVRIVSFGLESGSDKVLEYFRKPVRSKSVAESMRYADKHGIFTVANIIIGAPCETDEDLGKTLEFVKTEPIDEVHVKILSYIRGATLWEEAVRDGKITESEECVFADVSRGLSNRTLDVLKDQQQHMRNVFANDIDRRFRLMSKMTRYGTPYFVAGCR